MTKQQIRGTSAVVAVFVIGAVFLVVGAVAVWWSFSRRALAADVASFQAIPAAVISTDVSGSGKSRRGGRHSYRPEITYEYIVADRAYRSDEYGPSPPKFSAREQAQGDLEARGIVPGATIEVFYDPGDPARAVVSKRVDANHVTTMWVLSGFGAVFLLIGLGVTLGVALSPSYRARLRRGG